VGGDDRADGVPSAFGGLVGQCGAAHDVVQAVLTIGLLWCVLWWLHRQRLYVRI